MSVSSESMSFTSSTNFHLNRITKPVLCGSIWWSSHGEPHIPLATHSTAKRIPFLRITVSNRVGMIVTYFNNLLLYRNENIRLVESWPLNSSYSVQAAGFEPAYLPPPNFICPNPLNHGNGRVY
jgi:hypothetical protein